MDADTYSELLVLQQNASQAFLLVGIFYIVIKTLCFPGFGNTNKD